MSGFEIIELAITEHVAKDEIQCEDEKWQKLVLYYLARLKGLCDWRNNSRSKAKQIPRMHLKRCNSQELESRIIDNVTQKPIARISRKQQNGLEVDDVGCYLAAGYEEGKQQAVKIISRSLKYGVMTGILLKRGNCYRIAPEYLGEPVEKKEKPVEKKKKTKQQDKCILGHKLSVKSLKTNVRKDKKKKCAAKNKNKAIEMKKSNVTLKGRKRKQVVNNSCSKKKKLNSSTSVKAGKKGLKRNYEGNNSDESPPNNKKNKRASDTKVNLRESNSKSTFETISRSLTPIDDRRNKRRDVKAKRPRPKIQKPINYVPPIKKPRTKSQSRSPSHHTDDEEVRGRENINANSHLIINRFRMPRPRRYSDVMSSMSSSSLSSSCTRCDNVKIKRTRRK